MNDLTYCPECTKLLIASWEWLPEGVYGYVYRCVGCPYTVKSVHEVEA